MDKLKTKQCKKCKKDKDIKEFSKRAASKDGFQVNCKECNSVDFQRVRDYRLKRMRDYATPYRKEAEKQLGYELPTEVVCHHIDLDRTNNSWSNIMLFANQSSHLKYHWKLRKKSITILERMTYGLMNRFNMIITL